MSQKPVITIKDWNQGITSPHLGFSKIKSAIVDEVTGSVTPNYQDIQLNFASDSIDFTADAGTDLCTAGDEVDFIQGDYVAVAVSSTGTLPAGLSSSTQYYIITDSSTTFKLSTTIDGSAVDITDSGTGVHTVSVTAMGDVKHLVEDKENDLTYMVDDNGRVWVDQGISFTKTTVRLHLLYGNTLTSASGNGIAHFVVSDGSARYLFVYRNNAIDVFDVTTQAKRYDPVGESAITNGWKTMNTDTGTNNSHYSIVGQDNIIYFCDDRYVGSIRETPGDVFDPSDSASYGYNNQALDLLQGEKAEWLEELGIDLLVAGKTYNNVYPWNRRDNSFRIPLKTAEIGVYRLKNINNVVFILAGQTGGIYATQGTNVYEVARLGEYLTSGSSSNYVSWGGVGVKQGNLIFGADVNNQNTGIYMLKSTADGYSLILDYQRFGGNPAISVYAITSYVNTIRNGDYYRYGGEDGYYVFYDQTTATKLSDNETIIESPIYAMATKTTKDKLSKVEVQLDRKPDNGNVTIKYRRNLYDTYSDMVVFTLNGNTTSYQADVGGYLSDLENVQFEISPSGSGIQNGSVAISEIRFYE